jgi:hypothetical protein
MRNRYLNGSSTISPMCPRLRPSGLHRNASASAAFDAAVKMARLSSAKRAGPDGQITQKSVHPFAQKYSALVVGQIISTSSRHPVPLGGALRERHGRGMGMRWTRRRARRAMPMRTAKSCGPDASVLASSWRKSFRQRRWQESRSPGRSRISCKPLRGECRVIPV